MPRPVDRLSHVAALCAGKRVLDIGCLDETALEKHDTQHWLHGRIAAVAAQVIGVDLSDSLPAEGIETGPRSRIFRGDGTNPQMSALRDEDVDIIVAGEFIEHIVDPIAFIATMRRRFPGRRLVMTTPNGLAFANTCLGIVGREAQHPDHIHLFTCKALHTICRRAGALDYDIQPYRFYATEMILSSRGSRRAIARASELGIRLIERMFPLLSFGYIVTVAL